MGTLTKFKDMFKGIPNRAVNRGSVLLTQVDCCGPKIPMRSTSLMEMEPRVDSLTEAGITITETKVKGTLSRGDLSQFEGDGTPFSEFVWGQQWTREGIIVVDHQYNPNGHEPVFGLGVILSDGRVRRFTIPKAIQSLHPSDQGEGPKAVGLNGNLISLATNERILRGNLESPVFHVETIDFWDGDSIHSAAFAGAEMAILSSNKHLLYKDTKTGKGWQKITLPEELPKDIEIEELNQSLRLIDDSGFITLEARLGINRIAYFQWIDGQWIRSKSPSNWRYEMKREENCHNTRAIQENPLGSVTKTYCDRTFLLYHDEKEMAQLALNQTDRDWLPYQSSPHALIANVSTDQGAGEYGVQVDKEGSVHTLGPLNQTTIVPLADQGWLVKDWGTKKPLRFIPFSESTG